MASQNARNNDGYHVRGVAGIARCPVGVLHGPAPEPRETIALIQINAWHQGLSQEPR
jgi:3-deoxy-D-arabino-heptulosonate 7-phosphate (DAHP) synthase class II